MDYVFAFNVFEAVLWTTFGLVAVYKAVATPSRRRTLLAIAVLFFSFAVSEIIETQTGAWWRPVWLAALKGGCIVGLIVLVRREILWHRRNKGVDG